MFGWVLEAVLHEATGSCAIVRWNLWACKVSVVAQDHKFLLQLCDWKEVQLASTFFSVASQWWHKVNETQRISTKIGLELESLSEFWWN